ncbi:PREDICTED: uncharacterized protein LOC108554735 [Eufriesea mexicana]|uniref:uncharacterized protein LOC108554735 n=1 Tax=Eufriesea mexicana TaxID=516756 RepID=UPI00083BBE52|nr:PREDICTED: uncharacterized protein LOC108554735 [Eufriesea mexicana]
MKTAILLCTLCFASFALVSAEDMPATCMAKFGLSIMDLPALIQDNSDEGIRKRGCLEACAMQNMGLMNGNTIDLNSLDSQIDRILGNSDRKETVRDTVHECANNAADADECVVAQKFARCGLDQLKLSVQETLHSGQ